MNISDLEQSWEIVQDLSDDADVSSVDLISDDMDSGLGNFEDTSDLPLPAPVLPISGPRFSSPFQLDSTAPVFSKVHHNCTYEPGLPRPELVQRLEPTRIHGLQSGGLPVPKIRMKRPDSIVSVLETPAASSQLNPFSEHRNFSGPVALAKRQRVQLSAPQPQSSNVSRVKMASDSKLVQSLWVQVSNVFGHKSKFLQDLRHSSQQEEHVKRFLNQFAAGTLIKYFGALMHWFSICTSSRVDPWNLSDVGLADLLSIHKLARRSDGQGPGVSVTLKSLRWAFSHLHVKCLGDCVYVSVVSSFGKQRTTADRRETLPFSLFILCAWEKHLLRSTSTEVDVILIGAFLLLTWSSLRFADAQRCNIEGLCYSDQVLRGICWQTKTVSNLAWGLIGRGFLSYGSFTWLHKFLRTLDQIYYKHGQDSTIDFLFPSCTDSAIRVPIQAMQYAECLYFLRKYLRLFWHRSSCDDVDISAQSYTVHGLKSTILSYAAQLQLPEDMRRIQGKHRAVQASTRLYARDDVSAALTLQGIVRQKVIEGWRPSTPLARGGQAPLIEPKFNVERYRKDSTDDPWLFFRFQEPVEVACLEDSTAAADVSEVCASSSDSSSSRSSDSASDGAEIPEKDHLDGERGAPSLVGLHRQMWHVVLAPNDQPMASFIEQSLEGTLPPCSLRTACGHMLLSRKLQLHDDLELRDNQMLCNHAGCKKGWRSLHMV